MEKKIIEKKMKVFIYILVALFLILIGRVAFMQIIDGKRYRTLATQNHQRLITVEAPRGEIIDRNGVRIVSNKPVYTVSLVKLGLDDSERVIRTLSKLLEGDGNFKGMNAKQIEQEIQEKIKGHKRLYEPIRVAANVSQETINRIQEQRLELPGVNIDIEPVRHYPFNDLMGEVLGYVREITNEQLEAHKDEGYAMGDSYGQVGLENYYEGYLRGIKGARQVEVDAQGRPVRDLGIKPPVPGNNIILSVDHRLQRVAQDAVTEALNQAKNYAKLPPGKTMSAAAVAMDVNTGEVLAMASLPSYDLNIFSGPLPAKKYNELVSTGALRNHAIQTPYTPGSTFKMVTAAALLENKIVDINTKIADPGYYKYKNDWKPGGHGIVNVTKALGDSCDTFFYIFGIQAGPEMIGKYAAEFGLGELTGIDLPGEEAGRTASRELKRKIWEGNDWESEWREYDSMDMAIGQQESKYTAIQLANYMATIANGGTIYRPRMVKRVVGPDGNEIKGFSPEVVRKVNVSKESMDIVRQGIHEVVGGGTASSVFMGAPYTAAAKTGTAEVGDAAQNAHALFVAYAPFDKPEIAVSVIIEYGAKGSSIAGPVARKIIDGYFKFKKEDAEGKKPGQEQQNGPQQPAVTPAPQGQAPAGAGHGNNIPPAQGQGTGTGGTGNTGQPGGTNTTGGSASPPAGGVQPPAAGGQGQPGGIQPGQGRSTPPTGGGGTGQTPRSGGQDSTQPPGQTVPQNNSSQ
ncbi:MAG: penicillin-binding protein 2 [Bacillota bacterium]